MKYFDYVVKELNKIGYKEKNIVYSKTTKSIYYYFSNPNVKNYKEVVLRYSDHLNYNSKYRLTNEINIFGARKNNIDEWIKHIIDKNNKNKVDDWAENIKLNYYNLINSNKKIFNLLTKKENDNLKIKLIDLFSKNKNINLEWGSDFQKSFLKYISNDKTRDIILRYIEEFINKKIKI